MCGIYGQIEQFTEAQLSFLERQLRHRGPDERRWKEYDQGSFFHARLSIVDAAGGAQPMETDRYVIVFNGEIYNHQELRVQFSVSGRTRSDTETLLLLYEKMGTGLLPHLDGMFAFAIYDKQSGELLLARDRMGEKPLYYRLGNGHWSFASELNTLAGIQPLTPSPAAAVQFLVAGWTGPEDTIYEGVKQLRPGHFIRIAPGKHGNLFSEDQCWWSYHEQLTINHQRKSQNPNSITDDLFELLKTSIQRRVESSDLPVACFLSGGLDSSIVATLASFIKAPLPTYTFVFDDEFNEGPRAARIARTLRTAHRELHVNYDHIRDDIGTILLAYGEPFCDDSAIPSYYIAREAKKLNTVIINGDGGDELFGGYRRYVPLAWPAATRNTITGLSKVLRPLLPPSQQKFALYNYLHRLMESAGLSYPDKYFSSTTNLFYDEGQWPEVQRAQVRSSKDWIRRAFSDLSLPELKQFIHADVNTLLPLVLLKKVDISTMQHSLESRTVFFTPEILALAGGLPSGMLVSGNRTKVLLRGLAQRLLPAGMAGLPKRGFEAPLVKLVNDGLKPVMQDYLLTPQRGGIIHQLLPAEQIESIWYNRLRLSGDRRSKLLYTLFCLEFWWVNKQWAVGSKQ